MFWITDVKCASIVIFVVLNLCSYYSFQSSYPSWEPSEQGKQFLLNLRKFKEEKLPVHGNIPAPSPPRMWRGISNMGSNIGDRNRFMSREMPYNTGNHLGSLWLIEANQNNHPYLLDWYYTSRSYDVNQGDDPSEEPFGEIESRELWIPSNMTHNESGYEEYSNENRPGWAAFHLATSTSVPIFRESSIQVQSYNERTHTTRSHWWDRSEAKQGGQNETSFFEPPDFNQERYNYSDKFSDRGSEDDYHEQRLYSRDSHRLSRTYTDDLGAGEFNLHFGDIYSRPPETPPASF